MHWLYRFESVELWLAVVVIIVVPPLVLTQWTPVRVVDSGWLYAALWMLLVVGFLIGGRLPWRRRSNERPVHANGSAATQAALFLAVGDIQPVSSSRL